MTPVFRNIQALEQEVARQSIRLSSDIITVSFGVLMNLYKNKELIIQPEYQRLYRWTNSQKTALIESILLSIPIPPIFVAEDEEGIWELMDGLPILATVFSFFGELNIDVSKLDTPLDAENNDLSDEDLIFNTNKWELEAGGLLKGLKGFNIDTLPQKYKLLLKRGVCRVEILRSENNTNIKYELFKRLNSLGMSLNPQEVRTIFYRNADSAVMSLVSELSQHPIFKKLTNLSAQQKRARYDQELILRFVAFLNKIEPMDDNTEHYLNHFVEKSIHQIDFPSMYYKKSFNDTLQLLDSLNDGTLFKNQNNAFESMMVGLAQNIEKYKNNSDLLRQKIQCFKNDVLFKQSVGVKNRLQRANQIFSDLNL